jgi:hypothetical protein
MEHFVRLGNGHIRVSAITAIHFDGATIVVHVGKHEFTHTFATTDEAKQFIRRVQDWHTCKQLEIDQHRTTNYTHVDQDGSVDAT